jgi:organic hydroperoxide reductase OsmC/OhrA
MEQAMSEHHATIRWQREEGDFFKGRYSREHTWTFDGGITVDASASPSVVPIPYSNPKAVDPEEALLASIASCHMLSFLHVASKHGFQVDRYEDAAVGEMTKNEKGVLWLSSAKLQPKITYSGEKLPTDDDIEHLHHLAHEQCFIANSVKTEITVATD